MDEDKLLDAIAEWLDAKKDADRVRDELSGNCEAGYYWDRSYEREREEKARTRAGIALKEYVRAALKGEGEG